MDTAPKLKHALEMIARQANDELSRLPPAFDERNPSDLFRGSDIMERMTAKFDGLIYAAAEDGGLGWRDYIGNAASATEDLIGALRHKGATITPSDEAEGARLAAADLASKQRREDRAFPHAAE